MLNIYLASPRGFCAGVNRAIKILNGVLKKYGTPIFVNHEIIHNKIIVNFYKKKGVIFEENLEKIPAGSIIIFSAHGVSPKYVEKVKTKNIKYIDASCPLVLKVHNEAKEYLNKGYKIIYIGQKKHQEAIGVLGEDEKNIFIVENKNDIDKLYSQLVSLKVNELKVALLTQTTLSVADKQVLEDYIFSKFKNIEKPSVSDICFATTNRQKAVKEIIEKNNLDALIIVGSKKSSNSNKLKNIGEKMGIKSVLIDNFEDLDKDFLNGVSRLGISSGASVSHDLVDDLIKKLEKNYNAKLVDEIKVAEEKIDFEFNLELK